MTALRDLNVLDLSDETLANPYHTLGLMKAAIEEAHRNLPARGARHARRLLEAGLNAYTLHVASRERMLKQGKIFLDVGGRQ